MGKFRLIPLIFALLPLSATHASTMSLKERMAVSLRLEKIAPFVHEKYLPGSFVKELEKSLESNDDKARFKKLQGRWSKDYSKDIAVNLMGTSFEITRKKVPVVNVKITSLKPYTVSVNGGSQMIIRKDHFFADMTAALTDAGYEFGRKAKKKNAFLQLLMPEAHADALPPTVENSIYILGLSTFRMVGENLAPATRITEIQGGAGRLYSGLTEQRCDGQTMRGTYQINDQTTAVFTADRDRGVYINANGRHLVGKRVSPEPTEVCAAVANGRIPNYADSAGMRVYSTHRSACLYLQSARPAANLTCSAITAEASPNADALRADCAAMKQVGLSVAFEFYLCKDASCKESEMTLIPPEVKTMSQLAGWEAFAPAVTAANAALEQEFRVELERGFVRNENGQWSIVPPNRLSGARTSKFNELVAQIPSAITPDRTVPYFNFRSSAWGFAGLLDCCYDSACKARIYEEGGLDLVPSESIQ